MVKVNPDYAALVNAHTAIVNAMRTIQQQVTQGTHSAEVNDLLVAAHTALYNQSSVLFNASWSHPCTVLDVKVG